MTSRTKASAVSSDTTLTCLSACSWKLCRSSPIYPPSTQVCPTPNAGSFAWGSLRKQACFPGCGIFDSSRSRTGRGFSCTMRAEMRESSFCLIACSLGTPDYLIARSPAWNLCSFPHTTNVLFFQGSFSSFIPLHILNGCYDITGIADGLKSDACRGDVMMNPAWLRLVRWWNICYWKFILLHWGSRPWTSFFGEWKICQTMTFVVSWELFGGSGGFILSSDLLALVMWILCRTFDEVIDQRTCYVFLLFPLRSFFSFPWASRQSIFPCSSKIRPSRGAGWWGHYGLPWPWTFSSSEDGRRWSLSFLIWLQPILSSCLVSIK